MSQKQLDSLLKISEEVTQEAVSPHIKKISMIECGVKNIEWLIKMKHGAFTTLKLALDSADASDCIFTFRVLTGKEEESIEDQMEKTGWSILDIRYKRKFIILTLSAASKPYPSFKDFTTEFNSPELTVDELYTLPTNMLLALGYKYNDFLKRHSPKLETLTQAQIDNCIKQIQDCEDDIKKLFLTDSWSSNAMQEVLIDSVRQLTDLKKQMAPVLIG